MPVSSWSTTASDNATIDSASGVAWPEGMSPAQVNDSARNMMAEIKKWYNEEKAVTSDVSSAAATVDLTLPAGNFRAYRIIFANVRGSVNDSYLCIRTSSDSGSSYAATAGSYRRSTISVVGSSVAGSVDQTAIAFYVSPPTSSVQTPFGASGVITLTPSGTAFSSVHAQSVSYYDSGATFVQHQSQGFAPLGVNAVRFLMDSGNIVSGKFTVEGIQ